MPHDEGEVRWVNRTPHQINLYGPENGPDRDRIILTIPRYGAALRATTTVVRGVMYMRRVSGRPSTMAGGDARVIVSLPYAMACNSNGVLWVPYDEVRNRAGGIIGCRQLVQFAWGNPL